MAKYYEFFAGGGMAGAGLGSEWTCIFANDFDQKKAASYRANWSGHPLRVEDVAHLTTSDLPDVADLAWASFPCQDLSLAGAGAGLKGARSGMFWPFWRLMTGLAEQGRAPSLIALENVCGALTSHAGKDFAAICQSLAQARYNFGAVVMDAVHFVPQSRPRLFIIAAQEALELPTDVLREGPDGVWHTSGVVAAYSKLSALAKSRWLWLRLPAPPRRTCVLADVIEESPQGVVWYTAAETRRLIAMMSPLNLEKLKAAKRAGRRMVGAVYKRTRMDGQGGKVLRAEVRFDDIAGCLRTPGGGSSRQTVVIVEGDTVRARLLAPREAARLMGLPDWCMLPDNYNEAYQLAGDGVVVPVVRFLAQHLLEPMLAGSQAKRKRAA